MAADRFLHKPHQPGSLGKAKRFCSPWRLPELRRLSKIGVLIWRAGSFDFHRLPIFAPSMARGTGAVAGGRNKNGSHDLRAAISIKRQRLLIAMPSDASPIFCNRCLTQLTPGQGDFYVVKIEAFADPTPPGFSDEDLEKDVKQEMENLIAAMEDVSEREAMDQVCRRLTMYMCGMCYQQWIEDPTGSSYRHS